MTKVSAGGWGPHEREPHHDQLTSDEALVLSEWLEKLQMTDLSRVIDDPAVWPPIHRIAGTLDTTLPELFAADYGERLQVARQRLPAENDWAS